MTYRSLLVFLDDDPLCAQRTQVAMQIARDMDCHLVGVAPTDLIDFPLLPDVHSSVCELGLLAQGTLRDQAKEVAQKFRDTCRASGVRSFEAVVDESDQDASLVRHANCSDLIVLTQADPSAPGYRIAHALVEQIILYSARPTLLVPHAGVFDTVGSNILVAWDDSREAARALSNALPLLRRAKQVHIVGWSDGDTDDDHLRRGLDALVQWLMWHGVSAKAQAAPAVDSIADAMLTRADNLNADLIVMGGYRHARWTERLFDGATRGLLMTMTVPVLMSH